MGLADCKGFFILVLIFDGVRSGLATSLDINHLQFTGEV